jgi:hypothetical protein
MLDRPRTEPLSPPIAEIPLHNRRGFPDIFRIQQSASATGSKPGLGLSPGTPGKLRFRGEPELLFAPKPVHGR